MLSTSVGMRGERRESEGELSQLYMARHGRGLRLLCQRRHVAAERERERKARELSQDHAVVEAASCQRAMVRAFVALCYLNSSLFVLLIFLSFLLSSLRCKVSYLVAYSFPLLLICILLF